MYSNDSSVGTNVKREDLCLQRDVLQITADQHPLNFLYRMFMPYSRNSQSEAKNRLFRPSSLTQQ